MTINDRLQVMLSEMLAVAVVRVSSGRIFCQSRPCRIHSVSISSIKTFSHSITNDIHESLKDSLDIYVFFGRGFKELESQLISQLSSSIKGNYSLISAVTFVAHEDNLSIIPRISLDLSDPVLDGVEGLFIRDIIHQDETHCSSIISCCYRSIPLLSCCVLFYTRDQYG